MLTVHAQTVTIYRGGIAVPVIYTSLRSAVTASLANDSLVLSKHIFAEGDITITRNIVIQGTRTGDTQSVLTTPTTPYACALSVSNPGVAIPVKVTLRNITIRDFSSSPTGGAAIFANYNTILLLGGHMLFENNSSLSSTMYPGGPGGAIYSRAQVFVTDSTVMRNNRSVSAGAIYADTLVITGHTIFQGNTADDAAVVSNYLTVSGNAQISSNNARGISCSNQANLSGNAVIAENAGSGITMAGSLDVSGDVLIEHNNSGIGGGGIFMAGGTLMLSGQAIIRANHAASKGGGIFMSNARMTMKDQVQICNNTVDSAFGAGIYCQGRSIDIQGGQITGNNLDHDIPSIEGIGMAVYCAPLSTLVTTLKVCNARIFNPSAYGKRNEIYNGNKDHLLYFESDSTWWGRSDTSGVLMHIPADSQLLHSWVVASWSINGGAPVSSTTTSFPIKASFALNSGTAVNPVPLNMLQGNFIASSGSFSPAVAPISGTAVTTTYNAGPATATVNITGSVDADTFRSSPRVTGTAIGEQVLADDYSIYPNPSDGTFTISKKDAGSDIILAQVYDLSGRLIMEQALNLTNNSSALIHIKAQPGNYMLELRDRDGGKKLQKLSIQ